MAERGPPEVPPHIFDTFDERMYKCCGGYCHVKHGAWVICILNVVYVCFVFGGSSVIYPQLFLFFSIPFLIVVVALGCFIVGLYRANPWFVLPFIFYQVIGIITCAVGTVVCIVQCVKENNQVADESAPDHLPGGRLCFGLFPTLAFGILAIFVQFWFICVTFSCYRYFCKKRQFDSDLAAGAAVYFTREGCWVQEVPRTTDTNRDNASVPPPPLYQFRFHQANDGMSPSISYAQAPVSTAPRDLPLRYLRPWD